MRKLILFFCTILSLFTLNNSNAQRYPDLSGTWYGNGYATAAATISQSGKNLNIQYRESTVSGFFTGPMTFYVNEWNTNANIDADLQTIRWDNQIWTRKLNPNLNVPDIAGQWYNDVSPETHYEIVQNGTSLQLNTGDKQVEGYFYETAKIYVKEWNAYAELSQDGSKLRWNNQTWSKGSSKSSAGEAHQYCRFELSSFYYAAQLIGSVWGRSATEPPTPTAEAILAMDAHLLTAIQVFSSSTHSHFDECMNYSVARLQNLKSRLRSMTSAQIKEEINSIILELQNIISKAPFQCNNGVHPIALYVGGVHLGAAQAWASSQQCMPAPMPAVIAGVISNHLTTASTALTPYASCLAAEKTEGGLISAFNLSSITAVNLTSPNSILAHTQITGIESQLLWAIALSPCCCNCNSSHVIETPTANACDQGCQEYCRKKGYGHGKYNGKAPCMLGVVTEGGCDCGN